MIVDCTDAPSTRYLISDSAIVCGKPLVSGSALGTEGQITVYGYKGGPCYRCIFPNPPPPESVLTCGEGGILGPGTLMSSHLLTTVVGVIGVMQALEVIKIIVRGSKAPLENQETGDWRPSMTVFAAFDTPQWRSFRLRPRKTMCVACGDNPSITRETIQDGDYETLCMRTIPADITERISASVLGIDTGLILGIFERKRRGSCSH
jgi:adenylyltransferase and sulfurtransferase